MLHAHTSVDGVFAALFVEHCVLLSSCFQELIDRLQRSECRSIISCFLTRSGDFSLCFCDISAQLLRI